jgi:hypothetical protein
MVEMNKEGKRKILWLFSAVFALLIIALFLYSSFNKPSGAITETVGIIESVGGIPKEHGPTKIIASVRLNDGSIIQAHVLPGAIAQKERVAHIRILHRFLSGTKVYEVYRTERAN